MSGKASSTATFPLGNERSFVLIANPGSRRVELFQAALGRSNAPSAKVIAYADLLLSRADLAQQVPVESVVKIDSPGKDFGVEKLILQRGASAAEVADFGAIPGPLIGDLPFRKGEILCPHQWYVGFAQLMCQMESDLSRVPSHCLMNDVASSLLMFDKPRCHQFLWEHSVPVPRALTTVEAPIRSHAELVERMAAARMSRVFVKLAYGSSASGVAAYQIGGMRQQATTTVEMETDAGGTHLFNSRKIRTYTEPHDIRRLFDELCRHHVHVEEWIPKAGISGKTFDLRIVGVFGEPRFIVVRTSRHPITNLHLLNARGDVELVRQRLGAVRWEEMLDTCRRVFGLFPRCLYVALDMLIRADWRAHAVLELNAFGDLLPDVVNAGEDLYTAQINACRTHAEVSG